MEHRLRNGQHREEPLVQVRRTAQRRQLLFQGQQLNGRQDRGVQAERHLALRQGTFARQPLRFQGQQSHPFAGQGGAGALLERRRPDQSGQLHQRSRYGNHPQLGQSDQGLRAQYERHEGQDRNHLQRRGRVPSQLRHLPLRRPEQSVGRRTLLARRRPRVHHGRGSQFHHLHHGRDARRRTVRRYGLLAGRHRHDARVLQHGKSEDGLHIGRIGHGDRRDESLQRRTDEPDPLRRHLPRRGGRRSPLRTHERHSRRQTGLLDQDLPLHPRKPHDHGRGAHRAGRYRQHSADLGDDGQSRQTDPLLLEGRRHLPLQLRR